MSREMKDSGILAIGAIPKEWKPIRIKYLFQNGVIKSGPYGSALKEVASADGEYPIYNQANIINDDFSLRRNYISSKDYINMKRYTIRSGDIVFSMMGTVGKCSIVPEWIDEGIIDSHLFEATLNCLINKDYFKYSYDKDLCIQVIEQFIEAMNGSIMSGLNGGLVKNSFICLPSPTEQQQIVHFLDRKCTAINTAIEKTKKSIEKLEEYKKAVITKAVTKQEGWTECKLRFVANIVRGGSPRPIEAYITDGEGLNWVKIGDATGNGKYINNTKQRITRDGLNKTRLVPAGTLLLTNSMSFGHPYVLNIEGCIHDGWLAFFDFEKVTQDYLYYFLESDVAMEQFLQSVEGSVVNNLNIDKVKSSYIAFPSITEQNLIVKRLDRLCIAIDAVIEKKKKAIEKWEEYKKSLIYYAVTGKIDCRNEVI